MIYELLKCLSHEFPFIRNYFLKFCEGCSNDGLSLYSVFFGIFLGFALGCLAGIIYKNKCEGFKYSTLVTSEKVVIQEQLEELKPKPGPDLNQFTELGKKIIGIHVYFSTDIKDGDKFCTATPEIFVKPPSSFVVEGTSVKVPSWFEVSQQPALGIIIRKKGKDILSTEAGCHILGYCLAFDLVAMDTAYQGGDGDSNRIDSSVLSRAFDRSCPVSCALPKNRLKYPNNSTITVRLNGQVQQVLKTRDLMFPVEDLISYVSMFLTLEPFDLVLSTHRSCRSRLKSGDCLEARLNDGLILLKFLLETVE